MCIHVGITGGIGSGKSYVCKIIKQLGYPVFDSDSEAKELTNSHPIIKKKLIQLLGAEVYQNHELNRVYLASRLFGDDAMREKINAIIHPIVRETFKTWSKEQNSKIVFNEAAILIETGSYKQFDKLILVTAPLKLKIKRVVERDSISIEEVEARISTQFTDEVKRQYADFIIENDGRPVLPQIELILQKII